MKALITGDWQLDSRPPCDRLDDRGRSIRFGETKGVIMAMIAAANERGCDTLIHLGDLTEERNPDSATLAAAGEAFGAALKLGWNVHAIAGNHDGAIFDLSSSSLEAMGKVNDSFHVYHTPNLATIDGTRLLFIPYLHRKPVADVMREAIESCDGNADFVFAHYAYAGVQIGAKNLILPGDHLDASLTKAVKAKAAWFGHIHKQQVIDGDCPIYFPGSPVINDFGERNDPKGYSILDTKTGKREMFQLPPVRRWIQVDWRELGTGIGKGTPKFGKQDIVKIAGEYGLGESPQEAFKAALAQGLIEEPFYKVFDIRKATQAAKRGVISGDSGLQKALADYIAARWPMDPLAGAALESAIGALKASSPAAFDKSVVLKEVHMTDFLSHPKAEVVFKPGEPILVCGENGKGKTNLIEAVLFALTGQVSKGLKMASLVRQGASKATVELLLSGEKGDYRIRRIVSLNSKGAATHKVDVELKGDKGWTSLADGGIADTQAALGRLVGATFLSMRAVNFQFQRDPNPFIGAEPGERKAILAEILGLEAVGKAFKILNEDRLSKMRIKETTAAIYQESENNCDPEKLAAFESDLKTYEAKTPENEAQVKRAKAVLEAAIAASGAIGSERNTLQSVIDSLEGQADGALALRKSKADQESAYGKSRDERLASYQSAKKRVETWTAEASHIATREKALVDAKKALEDAKTGSKMPDLSGLESTSAKAAKDAVDARLFSKEAIQTFTEAQAIANTANDTRRALELQIIELMAGDIDTCSKCGQKVDASHIKAEIEALKVKAAEADSLAKTLLAKVEAAKALRADAEASEKKAQAVSDIESVALSKARSDAESTAKNAVRFAENELSKADMELASSKKAAAEVSQAESDRDALLKAGTEAKAAHETSMAALDADIAKAEAKSAEAKIKADEARKSLSFIDVRLAKAQGEVNVARDTEKTCQSELDGLVSTLANIKAQLEAGQQYLERAKAKKAELENATKAWQVADMASQALDPKAGLPVHLIDERLPALADAVNTYLGEFGSPEFSIAFSTRKEDGKETLDVLVDNGAEPRLDVAAYSGGQLDRIEFCLRMALGDLAEEMRDVRLGFVMMDEPGTHLDAEKKGALIKMVLERAADGRCPVAVIVSHDPKLMSAIPSRLIVTSSGIQAA